MQQTTTTTTVTEIPDQRRWQGRDWAKLGITGLLALALLRPGVSAQPEAGVPAVAATAVPVVVSTPAPTLAALAAPAILSTREAVFAGPYTVRGTGTPGSTVEVLVNGAPVGTAVVGADGNWRLDTTLAAGQAELVARAVDAGGQVVATGEAVNLAVGEALAAPTFDAPTGEVESGPITLSGTGTPGSRVRVRAGDTNLGTTVVGPDGRWEFETILGAGKQTVIVEALDASGNPVAASAPVEVNATGGLGVSVDAPTEGAVLQPGPNVISGKGKPGTVLEILNGDLVLGEVTVGQDGAWSVEVPLQQGTAAISARVKGTDQILNRPVRVTIGEAAQVGPACTEIAVGCRAWVTRAGGLNLRMRSAPAISPDNVIARLPIGTEMMVDEGPQPADGFTWWRVTTVGGQNGWVAGENLVLQPD